MGFYPHSDGNKFNELVELMIKEKQDAAQPQYIKCHICEKQTRTRENRGFINHPIQLDHCNGIRTIYYCVNDKECFLGAIDQKWANTEVSKDDKNMAKQTNARTFEYYHR